MKCSVCGFSVQGLAECIVCKARRRDIKFCKECGKEFIGRRPIQIYCSSHCRENHANHSRYIVPIPCPVCKKVLASYFQRKYCSVKCAAVHRGAMMKGKKRGPLKKYAPRKRKESKD